MPDLTASPTDRSSKPSEGDMTDFIHRLCRDHAEWIDDLTLGGSPPNGWRPLVLSLFEGMRIAMADAPGARVALARLEAVGDRLCVEIRNDADRPTPTSVLRSIERMVDEAERTSAEVCPFCGRDFGPGAAEQGLVVRHLGSRPNCRPSQRTRSRLGVTADAPACGPGSAGPKTPVGAG